MQKIYQSHSIHTLFYCLSFLFERMAYYGFRSVIVLYAISSSLQMDREEVGIFYAWFTGSIVISKIGGAILGDLVLGNRKSWVIGGLLNVIGAFSIFIPSEVGLYLALVLMAIGGGLYSPNLTAQFGKSYLNKENLLDSAYTLLHLVVNLGAMIGIIVIVYLGEVHSWNYGFALVGLCMIFALVFGLLTKSLNIKHEKTAVKTIIFDRKIVLSTLFLVFLFWGLFEMMRDSFQTYNFGIIEAEVFNIHEAFTASIETLFVFPLLIIASIYWSYRYSLQWFKLSLGFVFGFLGFFFFNFLPTDPKELSVVVFLIYLFLVNLAEVHIYPIIQSVLTKYINPKYLAIALSLAFIPSYLGQMIVWRITNETAITDNPMFLNIGGFGFLIIGISLLWYVFKFKNELEKK